MEKIRILWADDEIDSLKPQVFFLEKKGYDLTTVSNGHDLIDTLAEDSSYDLVFLDESMPGITGIETLSRIKSRGWTMPVVMVTKNEAENLMEEAIGSQISDYLIKPINPNQLLLTIKKLIDNKKLVSAKNTSDYQVAFRQLFMEISDSADHESWVKIYRQLMQWEFKLDHGSDPEIQQILAQQKQEANIEFSKFINQHYQKWFEPNAYAPVMSHNLMINKV